MPLRTLIQLRRPIWPNSEDSIGKEFGEIPKTKLSYWEATGPAQTAYQKLLPDVLNVLAEKQGPIPNSDFVWFSLYMVGLSPSTAAPYIMFASEQRSQRRRAMNYVKNSKILDGYPGMQVGEWPEAPHIGRQEQKGSSRVWTYRELETPNSITADSLVSVGFQTSAILSFHYPDRTVKATASVEVEIDNISYYFVPSHVLLPPHPTIATKNEAPEEIDNEGFDFGNLMEDEYLSEDDHLSTSLGSISSSSSSTPNPEEQSLNCDFESVSSNIIAQLTPMPHPSDQAESNAHGDETSTSCAVVSIDLDYALCRVTDNDTKVSSIHLRVLPSITESLAEPDENGTQVRVLTVHGLVNGHLSRTLTHVRLPHSSSYQEVYVAHFNSPVLAGDCGAMVYADPDGQVFGHIITGSASSTGRTAFVMPVKRVHEDISRRLSMLRRTRSRRTADASRISRTDRINVSGDGNAGRGLYSPPADDSSTGTPSAGMANDNHLSTLSNLEYPARSSMMPPLSPSWTPSPSTSFTNLRGIEAQHYGKTQGGYHIPPLQPMTTNGQLVYRDSDSPIKIDIHGTIDKGFFPSEGDWNCYRRNYFSCMCAFTLTPHYVDAAIQYTPSGSSTSYQVFGFSMSISAVVSGSESHSVGLIQHTPMGGKRPVLGLEKVRLTPKPSTQPSTQPHSPRIYHEHHAMTSGARAMYEGSYSQADQGSYPMEHIFERIQFKQATANNGRRRAVQQYFHLVVELYVDVGSRSPDQWLKVAQRKSAQLIVRGRSPGHYQTERRESTSSGPGESSGMGGEAAQGIEMSSHRDEHDAMTSSKSSSRSRSPTAIRGY
ncbi:hypothetical protein F4820DRAFT_436580 [Hypoxylon rubiginosum]|uniref:Uncharacterized protein n=1 Tax=Hypoxylon rubiginosum TaxID=110542 RepID=A0ACB9YM83_9PEZI|nr:hypothetical protein F4820DRAFT_436580 [Hypoxylon rubiginosum]